MKIKATAAIALLLLLCSSLAIQVSAQTRAPGVKAEDYFTYTINTYWTSTNASEPVPADLAQFNSTKSYNMTISNISGANVTTDDIWAFNNGTTKNAVVIQNLDTGNSLYMLGLVKIIGANIEPNDVVYPYSSEDYPWKVNYTVSTTYYTSSRDTNVISINYPIEDPFYNTTGTLSFTYLFDKATGVLVEERDETNLLGEHSLLILQLSGTNLWQVNGDSPATDNNQPAQTSPYIVAAIVVAVVVVLLVISVVMYSSLYSNKKGSKKRKRR